MWLTGLILPSVWENWVSGRFNSPLVEHSCSKCLGQSSQRSLLATWWLGPTKHKVWEPHCGGQCAGQTFRWVSVGWGRLSCSCCCDLSHTWELFQPSMCISSFCQRKLNLCHFSRTSSFAYLRCFGLLLREGWSHVLVLAFPFPANRSFHLCALGLAKPFCRQHCTGCCLSSHWSRLLCQKPARPAEAYQQHGLAQYCKPSCFLIHLSCRQA